MNARDRSGRRLAVALLLLGAILAVAGSAARADTPRLTASIAYGGGGLFHDEYVAGILRASEMGRFRAGVFGGDLAFVFPSHLMLGARAHTLRTDLDAGPAAGRLDLVPVTLFVGYRRPALSGRMGGFLGLGAGVATARFTPAATISSWTPPAGRDGIDVTRERPSVFELSAGVDFVLSSDFSLELAASSVFVDTEVAFDPAPIYGGEFAPNRAYRVRGRHLTATLALRWWAEFW